MSLNPNSIGVGKGMGIIIQAGLHFMNGWLILHGAELQEVEACAKLAQAQIEGELSVDSSMTAKAVSKLSKKKTPSWTLLGHF